MLKSMTAYGRSSKDNSIGRFVAEIQSVNRKFLEISVCLPLELTRFEAEIKKWVGAAVSRGQVTVKLSMSSDETTPIAIRPNLPLARQIKKAWDEIAADLGLKEGFKLEMLVEQEGILIQTEEFKDEGEYRKALKEVLDAALKNYTEMKRKEGLVLQDDIKMRLDNMQNGINQIALKAPNATAKFRQKLVERLQEVLPGFIENEERILREVCVYAEKVDIAEEITRFNSHLKQFEDLLNSDADNVGKTLEFLVQELNREVNTIGSKASDVEVSKLVIEIKSELERIREQIQNVE